MDLDILARNLPRVWLQLTESEERLVHQVRGFDTWKPAKALALVVEYVKARNGVPLSDALKVVVGDMRTGTALQRHHFVYEVVKEVVAVFGGSVEVEFNGGVLRAPVAGRVEFVVKVQGQVVGKVVEFAGDGFESALGQCVMELYGAYETSKHTHAPPTLFGITTNAATWTFVHYTPTNPPPNRFKHSVEYPLHFPADEDPTERLQPIAETLFTLLFSQFMAVTRAMDKHAADRDTLGPYVATTEAEEGEGEKVRLCLRRLDEMQQILVARRKERMEQGGEGVWSGGDETGEKLRKYGRAFARTYRNVVEVRAAFDEVVEGGGEGAVQ
ncbi:hypothetical protein HK104_008557 [Borealophlyctis nickersoniae]|nr:hypothetical protein HK104_008557 [Borealophlyctis nickersoniae]